VPVLGRSGGMKQRRRRQLSSWLVPAWLALSCLAAPVASAQIPLLPQQAPLLNLIDVLVIDRHLIAFDALGSRTLDLELERDEVVQWSGAEGEVALVVTDRRALAATPRSSQWQELRFRLSEAWPQTPILSTRLVLLLTDQRALGFDSNAGAWSVAEIGLQERVQALRIGTNNAIIVTNRRALGLSPEGGGFWPTPMRLYEQLEAVEADDNLATITTNQRVLLFRARFGSWSSQNRLLHGGR